MSKRKYMKIAQNSIILCTVLLAGCASTKEFDTYVDAQKSFSRDQTVTDAARIAALTELAKDATSEVKVEAIKAIQQIQASKREIKLEQPRGWFGF
jgi:PBP1b-binding outer membrane lipoprotein LpoB